MSRAAAAAWPYKRVPRRTLWELVGTGGKWFMERVWRACLYYVRRSNAWPYEIIGGYAWQRRKPAPEDSQQR